MLWKVINNNVKNIEFFDFGGAGNQNIDNFKKSFGGKIITYQRWIRSNILLDKITLFAKYLSKKGILKLMLSKKENLIKQQTYLLFFQYIMETN